MSPIAQRQVEEMEVPPGDDLDPALLRIIEALARSDAKRDYAAALEAARDKA
jgi:hypothetical protein